jgi:hypothetical protein
MFLKPSGWCRALGRDAQSGFERWWPFESAGVSRLFFSVSIDETGDALHGGADLFQ